MLMSHKRFYCATFFSPSHRKFINFPNTLLVAYYAIAQFIYATGILNKILSPRLRTHNRFTSVTAMPNAGI